MGNNAGPQTQAPHRHERAGPVKRTGNTRPGGAPLPGGTRGGPLGSTNTLVRYMVQEGYSAQRIGYASAVAIIFFVLVAGFALLQRALIPND